MYKKLPNLILGFHGCDRETFENVVHNGMPLKKSENSYDWLGNGVYFWEQNFHRALEWAQKSKKVREPAVIGAVIDLGYCLNLTDSASAEILRRGYDLLVANCELTGTPIPQNHALSPTEDVLLRDLDCAVIQQIHHYNAARDLPRYDSVRGIFFEGGAAYPGSEFRERTHVQLCVTNPNCIKGYFNPLTPNENFTMP